MKALSERAAQNCEDAKEPVCKCRCGGLLHGAKRGSVRDLSIDDPHSIYQKCLSCGGDGKKVFVDRYSASVITYPCEKCNGTGWVMPKPKKAE